jgi:hypothetical protein
LHRLTGRCLRGAVFTNDRGHVKLRS